MRGNPTIPQVGALEYGQHDLGRGEPTEHDRRATEPGSNFLGRWRRSASFANELEPFPIRSALHALAWAFYLAGGHGFVFRSHGFRLRRNVGRRRPLPGLIGPHLFSKAAISLSGEPKYSFRLVSPSNSEGPMASSIIVLMALRSSFLSSIAAEQNALKFFRYFSSLRVIPIPCHFAVPFLVVIQMCVGSDVGYQAARAAACCWGSFWFR